jgi:hypothetical protein
MFYGPPDPGLLEESYNTLWVCQYGEGGLHVVNAKQLLSVVAMVPFKPPEIDIEEIGHDKKYYYFVVEKPGLDVFGMREANEEEAGEE